MNENERKRCNPVQTGPIFTYTNFDGWDGLYEETVENSRPTYDSNLLCCSKFDKVIRSTGYPHDKTRIFTNYLEKDSINSKGCPLFASSDYSYLTLTERGWTLTQNGIQQYATNAQVQKHLPLLNSKRKINLRLVVILSK